MKTLTSQVGLMVMAMMVSLSAAAQGSTTSLDTAGAVAQIGEINTAVAAVGGALVAAAAVAVGFKWLKGAIFS